MYHILSHRDKALVVFEIKNNNVVNCVINKDDTAHLPLPLKRIVHQRKEFVESESDVGYYLNEDGCYLFDKWLGEREIPLSRNNYELYINKRGNARQWLLENHGMSYNDCYWIQSQEEDLDWEDILEGLDSLDTLHSIRSKSNTYSGNNATLGGQLEKFWYKENGRVKLCKKVDMSYDILALREILATLIYERQGYDNYCGYSLLHNTKGNVIGCTCECFTNPDIELVTAYDLLEECNMTQVDDVWERIVEFAVSYGLAEAAVRDYLDILTIVDYLITNRDRHQCNIAFLRDAVTLKLIKPALIFDSGSSKFQEGRKPETYLRTKVNGLYSTEVECLKHVRSLCSVNVYELPDQSEYRSILDLSSSLTEERKEYLVNLYLRKKQFIADLQKRQLQGEDIVQYLDNLVSKEEQYVSTFLDRMFED